MGGCSNSTRGIFAGGQNTNVIQYITIATTGNSIDFGDLTVSGYASTAVANASRACLLPGSSGSGSNVINYVTIATTGNAIDFGDLVSPRKSAAGMSNANGGTQ
jgi:hypothetical protein